MRDIDLWRLPTDLATRTVDLIASLGLIDEEMADAAREGVSVGSVTVWRDVGPGRGPEDNLDCYVFQIMTAPAGSDYVRFDPDRGAFSWKLDEHLKPTIVISRLLN
jgi:hypothetical protein